MYRTWNYCNIPAWRLASVEFNEQPKPIEIQGVGHANAYLFRLLEDMADPAERAKAFEDFMCVQFHLHEWDQEHSEHARRSLKNSYLRFLRGWGFDSNSIEAAVLKAWVESRFGLPPTFHRGKVMSDDPKDQMAFAMDRMKGSERTNAINQQFDLLYAFCQYELGRRHPSEQWFELYRGTQDSTQYETLEVLNKRERIVRLNNLNSFTPDQERAFEFGSTVWQTRVPLVKIVFFSQLLPSPILKGEDEFLVLGGAYRVKTVL
jgi:NAD+--dinitrogen-reductase ADP-D-ribosyltransferase